MTDRIAAALGAADLEIRDDLVEAYRTSWAHIAGPGSWFTGEQRIALAQVAAMAYEAVEPLPPWVAPSTVDSTLPEDLPISAAAADTAYRLARHASTITEDWYRSRLESGLTPEQYVEIVGVTVAVVPVLAFCRGLGIDPPDWPEPTPGEPTGLRPSLADGPNNWVPVDRTFLGMPGVVTALSSVPGELANLGATHAAQYLPFEGMGEMDWTRGTLDRRQIEFVAARLSVLRECFY